MLDSSALLIIITAAVNGAVSLAVLHVKMRYIERDVAEVRKSDQAAHWRLDELDAPQAPAVSRIR